MRHKKCLVCYIKVVCGRKITKGRFWDFCKLCFLLDLFDRVDEIEFNSDAGARPTLPEGGSRRGIGADWRYLFGVNGRTERFAFKSRSFVSESISLLFNFVIDEVPHFSRESVPAVENLHNWRLGNNSMTSFSDRIEGVKVLRKVWQRKQQIHKLNKTFKLQALQKKRAWMHVWIRMQRESKHEYRRQMLGEVQRAALLC